MFKWIALLLIGTFAFAAFDTNSIPNASLLLGKSTTAVKKIIFNNNAGSGNPVIRMNAGALEFANDGVTFSAFSAGVPSGVVAAFVGTVAPSTWYIADGSSKAVSGDVSLFGVLGASYGSVDVVRPTVSYLLGSFSNTISSCVGVSAGFYVLDVNMPLGSTVVTCSGGLLTTTQAASGNGVDVSVIAGHMNLPDMRGRFGRGFDNGAGNDPDAAGRSASNAGGNTGNNVGTIQADAFQQHTHTFNYHNGGSVTGSFEPPGSSTSVPTNFTTNGANSGNISTETRPKNVYFNYIIKR